MPVSFVCVIEAKEKLKVVPKKEEEKKKNLQNEALGHLLEIDGVGDN